MKTFLKVSVLGLLIILIAGYFIVAYSMGSIVKAGVFGLIAGLVGCYRGLTTKGGPKGVGVAVNETLVLCVLSLFAVNVVLTTIGVRFGTGR